jgi:hypothetical protein
MRIIPIRASLAAAEGSVNVDDTLDRCSACHKAEAATDYEHTPDCMRRAP